MPAWALAPVPERVEGPLVQVRRVVESRDPTDLSTLRKGFDETKGTIEIADEGPFLINDCRVVRVRFASSVHGPVFVPIIRIDRPTLESVRSSARRDRARRQEPDARFAGHHPQHPGTACHAVVSLLVRRGQPDASQLHDHARQPGEPAVQRWFAPRVPQRRDSRIRFEGTLIRGMLSRPSIWAKARSTSRCGIRSWWAARARSFAHESDPGANHRFSTVGSVLASRGPVFEWRTEQGKEPSRPGTSGGPFV